MHRDFPGECSGESDGSAREDLNAQWPCSVLVMQLILKAEPYGLIKVFRLFMNSYIRVSEQRTKLRDNAA